MPLAVVYQVNTTPIVQIYDMIQLHIYRIAGKFGREKFGKSFLIRQTKTIQISTYNYNLLAESIHLPNFFAKCSK